MDLKKLLGDKYKDDMTATEIAMALKDIDLIERSVLEGYVTKDTADKYATEAAEYKKQLRARQSEEEQAAAKAAEEQSAIRQELEALRTQKLIGDHRSRLLELRYDPSLATATAEALVHGDLDTVFRNQALHIETCLKAAKADALSGMAPPPGAASPASGVSDAARIATEIGKQSGTINAQTSDIMKQYTGG